MSLYISVEDPAQPDIIELLEIHLSLMRSISPPDSVHALDLDGLRSSEITFWTARQTGTLVGCGALKEIGATHGEIKSMHVRDTARGQGVAAALVRTVLTEANARQYQRLSLETGSQPQFAPARRLYSSFGFDECGPFGSYAEDPHSTFMTLQLRK
ncbi:MAG: GNAT family N-acetyltransferase [Pseudomonadota bacterium]